MMLRSLAIGAASIALLAAPALADPPQSPKPAAAAPVKPATPPAAKPAKPAMSTDADLTSKVQAKLKELKLYSGDVDGKSNADFVKAVKGFQTSHKLKATGRLNKATQKALGI